MENVEGQNNMKLNVKKVMKIAGVLVVASGLVFAGYSLRSYYDNSQKKSAQNVGQKFIEDITAGRFESAYNLTGEAIKNIQTHDEFGGTIGNLTTNNLAVENPTVMKGKQEDKQVYFYTQLAGNLPASSDGGTDALFSLVLVKEKGSWRVNNVLVQ